MTITPITVLQESDLRDKKVLIRVDFNVQVYEGRILDDLRIRKTLETIVYVRGKGAKVILVSHNESKDGTGLLPVCEYINEMYKNECGQVTFISDFMAESTKETIASMNSGDVILFENLRVLPGEKANDVEFSKYLASLADLYVNDAFAVSHRKHASVVGVPALFPGKKYAGIQLMKEVDALKKALKPSHPFIFILGGAKFETKLPLIQKFSETADMIFLGGALLNDVLKAKGFDVGMSLVSAGEFDLSGVISNPKVLIPTDVVVERGGQAVIVPVNEVLTNDAIMDVGPSFTSMLKQHAESSQFILWNGPMGNYEKGYKDQTIGMAKVVFESKAQALLGGGDTTAAIKELGYEEKESEHVFISTGGGAMLEFLQYETLPGILALE
ncbi:MAG: phosphoglycerate kinase [Candidatus Taylorbacteria bacterium]|nr:phosphoglycerate kinase [Candidatus Taylorbacteria bacterium]